MFHVGRQIGSYKLVRKLGEGGFGEVWLAENPDLSSSELFAIKLPRTIQIDLRAVKEEIFNWILSGRHKNILPIIECETFDNQIAIVSEFAPDGSLKDLIDKYRSLPVSDTITLCLGILDGLIHLHKRKIVHRDLKPENILLHGKTPRLTDFGISRALTDNSYSTTTSGTMYYMAPEAFDGKRNVQTDIWAVGVILYRMLSGKLPFPQTDQVSLIGAIVLHQPAPLPDNVPPLLKDIVSKAVAKNPAERYQTAAEMSQELKDFQKDFSSLHEAETIEDISPAFRLATVKVTDLRTINEQKIIPEVSHKPGSKLLLIPYRKGDKWGFCDASAEMVIEALYNRTGIFFNGLAKIQQGCNWGFINRSGEIQIPLKYKLVEDFSECLAAVKAGFWKFVKPKGTEIIMPDYHLVGNFSEERAAVRFRDLWGFVNPRGTLKIAMNFDEVHQFVDGLAAVKTKDGWGFIDKDGQIEIPFQYQESLSFSEKCAAVKIGNKWGLIDRNGKQITPFHFDMAYGFGEGLMLVRQNGRYFYINHQGNEQLAVKYDLAGTFSNGLARVSVNGKYGYINHRGDLVIPLKYESANDFREQLALVKMNRKWGYVGTDGKEYFEE